MDWPYLNTPCLGGLRCALPSFNAASPHRWCLKLCRINFGRSRPLYRVCEAFNFPRSRGSVAQGDNIASALYDWWKRTSEPQLLLASNQLLSFYAFLTLPAVFRMSRPIQKMAGLFDGTSNVAVTPQSDSRGTPDCQLALLLGCRGCASAGLFARMARLSSFIRVLFCIFMSFLDGRRCDVFQLPCGTTVSATGATRFWEVSGPFISSLWEVASDRGSAEHLCHAIS